jgi:hypothetical protein
MKQRVSELTETQRKRPSWCDMSGDSGYDATVIQQGYNYEKAVQAESYGAVRVTQ